MLFSRTTRAARAATILATALTAAAVLAASTALAGPGGAINWVQLSTANGDLENHGPGDEQTAALILDVDGDGLNDFVIAERSQAPAVTWFRRGPEGWTRHVVENGQFPIEAGGDFADIDGDGDLDVSFAADSRGNQIWWWENPAPAFDPATPWTRRLIKNSGGNQHHDQIFGDFDGDGDTELAFWNQNAGGKLFLAEIPADPLVTEPWSFVEISDRADNSEGLAKADIDGDGKIDIVGAGYWFKHEGGTTFTANEIDATQPFTRSAAGQFVQGGRPEVAIVPGDADGPLYFYQWNEGSQAWDRTTLIPFVIHGHSLQARDIDGDGNLDLFVAEMGSPGAGPNCMSRVLFGDGAGNFSEQVVSVGFANHESKVGDLDGDGDLDILTKPFSFNTPRLDIFLQNGSNFLPLDQWRRHDIDTALPYTTLQVEAGDMDGDGLADLVTGAWWFKHPGAFEGTWTRQTFGSPMNQFALMHDFDGDGDLDVLGTQVIGAGSSNQFAWARNDGGGAFTVLTNIDSAGSGDFLQGVALADFGQGPRVLVSWHNGAGGVYQIAVPADPSAQQWPQTLLTSTTLMEDVSIGDIDRDGDSDVLLGTIWLRNNGDGTFAEFTLGSFADLDGDALADRNELADINGDGRLDAVIALELGTLVLWFEAPVDPTQPWTRHIVGDSAGQGFAMDVEDFDRDGDPDIVVGEHRGSPDNRVLMFENLGAGAAWNAFAIDTDSASIIDHHDGTQAVDIDLDGDLDLVSIGYTNAKAWIYENLAIDGQAWWGGGRDFRVPVAVNMGDYARFDKPAELDIDFGAAFEAAGAGGSSLDVDSIRVIEVDANGDFVDTAVDFQFDVAPNFDPVTNARGTVTFMMDGQTPALADRFFHVYFDADGAYDPAAVPPRLATTDNVFYEGYDSVRIESLSGDYTFHKAGGAFAAIVDNGGADWLGYRNDPTSDASGWYRGTPNAVNPEDVFHPGRTTCSSAIVSAGPLKTTIDAQSNDALWRCRWEIFPEYARLTMLAVDHPYWILYEGTPGGSTDSDDFIVESNGTTTPADTEFTRDIAGDEWIYLGDAGTTRALFYAQHDDADTTTDRWFRMAGPSGNPEGMMHFGFGRAGGVTSELTTVPRQFTIGLLEDNAFAGASARIQSAYKPLNISVGPAESFGGGSTLPTLPSPRVDPNGGQFFGAVQVSITTNNPENEIRYTLDGSDPGPGATLYAAPFAIAQTTTVTARAYRDGFRRSPAATATFLIDTASAAPPTINPNGGDFAYFAAVTLATPTPGATIRYTLDGSTPDESSTIYAPGLRLTASATLTARVFADGLTASPPVAADFRVFDGTRVSSGLAALYEFNDALASATVADTSGVAPALDLTIANPANATRFPGGVTINASTLIASAGAAGKIDAACRATNEITVEAWLSTADANQNGPARIVSMSADPFGRNFTLGQGVFNEGGNRFEFRLRTTTTGDNGSSPAASTPTGTLAADELTHVVYTRTAAGVATIYVNGAVASTATIGGDLSNWNAGYALGLANELTGDRPWLGTLNLVAIYGRALTEEEIAQNAVAGPDPGVRQANMVATY